MITLAVILSERASLTLAVLATVIWLPWALLSVKRSPWAWMTLAMLGMLWRGETWKYGCLTAEAQLSQCLQSSPKTTSSGEPALIVHDEARCAQSHASLPFLAGEFVEARRCVASGAQTPQEDCELHKGRRKAPANLSLLDSEGYLVLLSFEPSLGRRALRLGSQADFSRFRLKLPYPSWPNTGKREALMSAAWMMKGRLTHGK
jgi:hypothetical protein